MFHISILESFLDREEFVSGQPELDRYLRQQASQEMRRRITSCFVALEEQTGIVGFYTLASASIALIDLPESLTKRLPRYPSIPAVRLGRLAVDHRFQGRGLGAALLVDALKRVLDSEIAAFALLVDAKDESAASFYRHHGFLGLPESPLRFFLPMETARALLS